MNNWEQLAPSVLRRSIFCTSKSSESPWIFIGHWLKSIINHLFPMAMKAKKVHSPGAPADDPFSNLYLTMTLQAAHTASHFPFHRQFISAHPGSSLPKQANHARERPKSPNVLMCGHYIIIHTDCGHQLLQWTWTGASFGSRVDPWLEILTKCWI